MDTPQDKKDTLADFLARVDNLGKALEVGSDRQLAKVIKMSKSNLPAMREKLEEGEGGKKVLRKWWDKLEAAEKLAGVMAEKGTKSLGEDVGQYVAPPPKDMRINPRFAQLPADPTRRDVEAYVAAYLDKACQIPGGISHAYLELREAWPMEKIERLLKNHQSP